MGIGVAILCFIALAIILGAASRWVGRLRREIERKGKERSDYERDLLSSVKNIESNICQEQEDKKINVNKIVKRSSEIKQSQEVRRAIKEELGVE